MFEFQKFSKIPRLSRDCVITEKIDGTNAQICIVSWLDLFKHVEANTYEAYNKVQEFIEKYCLYVYNNDDIDNKEKLFMFAGSRKRWLDVSSNGDNYGFAKWVKANAEELIKLGEGRHYGEWYGQGIQRKYGLDEKRFALFNVGKWVSNATSPLQDDKQQYCPSCCEVVPILYNGMFDTYTIFETITKLKWHGSKAVPGFMNPEGIVIYHKASGQLFKKTTENDERPKGDKNV